MGSFDDIGFEILIILEGQIYTQVGEQLFVILVDSDLVQLVLCEFVPDKSHQGKTSFQVDQILLLYSGDELLGVVKGDLFTVEVKTFGQTARIIHDLVDGCLEPAFDVSPDDIAGKEEQQKSGDERERNEKDEQPDLKMCARDFPLPLEEEFDHVPSQNEREDEDEDDEYDHEREQEYSRDRKFLGAADEKFDDQKENNQKNDDGSDDTGAFFSRNFHRFARLWDNILFFSFDEIVHVFQCDPDILDDHSG